MRKLVMSALAVTVMAAAASPARAGVVAAPEDYCRPSATGFDPRDVPPEGSRPVRRRGVKQRNLTVDGVTTRLLESGRRSNDTAVVFLHGLPSSSADFAHLMPLVATDGGRAIGFDIRGFGHSEDSWKARLELGPGVNYLDRVLRRLDVRKVHLVAHDVGAAIGLEWGARHPDRLRSVTLIDGGMLFDYEHHNFANISRSQPGGELFFAGLNRASFIAGSQEGQPPNKPLPGRYLNRVYDDLDRETRCAIMEIYRSTEAPEIRTVARRQARRLARRPERPALVFWGRRDPFLPVRHAFQQKRGLPSARVEIFEDSGHWPFVDSPNRARKLIAPFVRRAMRNDSP